MDDASRASSLYAAALSAEQGVLECRLVHETIGPASFDTLLVRCDPAVIPDRTAFSRLETRAHDYVATRDSTLIGSVILEYRNAGAEAGDGEIAGDFSPGFLFLPEAFEAVAIQDCGGEELDIDALIQENRTLRAEVAALRQMAAPPLEPIVDADDIAGLKQMVARQNAEIDRLRFQLAAALRPRAAAAPGGTEARRRRWWQRRPPKPALPRQFPFLP